MDQQQSSGIHIKIGIDVTDKVLILTPASGTYKYSLIWLHGMNMQVQKFYNIFLSDELIHLLSDFKVILPQAPTAPVRVEGKAVPSWFDVTERKFGKPFDLLFGRSEILSNAKTISDLIETEAKALGGDYSKVFLGGFSQGCALALYAGLSLPQKLGGIVGYAGYFFEITPELADDRQVLVIHGHKDKIRPWTQVEHTYEPLKDKENVKFSFFDSMGHDMNTDEARKALYDFLREHAK